MIPELCLYFITPTSSTMKTINHINHIQVVEATGHQIHDITNTKTKIQN